MCSECCDEQAWVQHSECFTFPPSSQPAPPAPPVSPKILKRFFFYSLHNPSANPAGSTLKIHPTHNPFHPTGSQPSQATVEAPSPFPPPPLALLLLPLLPCRPALSASAQSPLKKTVWQFLNQGPGCIPRQWWFNPEKWERLKVQGGGWIWDLGIQRSRPPATFRASEQHVPPADVQKPAAEPWHRLQE